MGQRRYHPRSRSPTRQRPHLSAAIGRLNNPDDPIDTLAAAKLDRPEDRRTHPRSTRRTENTRPYPGPPGNAAQKNRKPDRLPAEKRGHLPENRRTLNKAGIPTSPGQGPWTINAVYRAAQRTRRGQEAGISAGFGTAHRIRAEGFPQGGEKSAENYRCVIREPDNGRRSGVTRPCFAARRRPRFSGSWWSSGNRPPWHPARP